MKDICLDIVFNKVIEEELYTNLMSYIKNELSFFQMKYLNFEKFRNGKITRLRVETDSENYMKQVKLFENYMKIKYTVIESINVEKAPI